MGSKVVIIGAKGRFGRAAANAFHKAGWQVKAFARNWPAYQTASKFEVIEGDAFDRNKLVDVCRGADVIVNALNPLYENWATELPLLTGNIIAAAKASGATVMIPGNVYNYGLNFSPVMTEETIQIPNTRKGKLRVEMEQEFRDATKQGVRTIVLRGGDFIEQKQTGNWFETYIAAKANAGKTVYPGPLNLKHAWAYLPDMARAMVDLARKRHNMRGFEEFGFEGYNLTGSELVLQIEKATGMKQKISKLPWFAIKLMGLISPRMREVCEMRYLWDVPHSMDGSKLREALPNFIPTPKEVAFRDALAKNSDIEYKTSEAVQVS